jgi:hypothetical protein
MLLNRYSNSPGTNVTFSEVVTGSDAPVAGALELGKGSSPPVQAAADSAIRANRDATERARMLTVAA